MNKVILYTKTDCPYCRMAKELFSARRIPFEEIRIDLDESKRDEMLHLSKERTVPQIIINGHPIGGYDALAALAKSGKLDALLKP